MATAACRGLFALETGCGIDAGRARGGADGKLDGPRRARGGAAKMRDGRAIDACVALQGVVAPHKTAHALCVHLSCGVLSGAPRLSKAFHHTIQLMWCSTGAGIVSCGN